MKINFYDSIIRCDRLKFPKPKLDKRMSTLLLSALIMSNVSGAASAQTITINERGASLKTVLEKIRTQIGADMVGDLNLLNKANPVNLNISNKDVRYVLQELSKNQPIEVVMHKNTLVAKEKSNTASPIANSLVKSLVSQQDYVLNGRVLDKDGKPLKGANIKINGISGRGSVSADDGSFSISVSRDAELLISMVGYESQLIQVGGKERLSIVLKLKESEISEAIVTAYSTFNRETFTGSANTITKKDIQKMATPNILAIIQSLDPSFVLTENIAAGSNPNVVPESSMRGIGNITGASSNPLVILDGFQISMRELYDIDIERIQSIHILKDATATALYGSRGANGVIMVETSLPKDGRMTISYSMAPTANFVDLSSYNILNAKEKLEYERLAGVYTRIPVGDHASDYYNQVLLENTYNEKLKEVLDGVDTYWLKQPIRNTLQTSHNITIGGGANNVRYQLSGNYANRMGTMKGADRTTYGANFRLEYRLPNKFTFSNLAAYTGANGKNSPYGTFSQYATMNPYWRVYDENGDYISRYDNNVNNPLFVASLNSLDKNSNQVVRNNLSLEWRPSDAWMLNATGSIEKTFNSSDVFKSPYHPDYINVTDLASKGSYSQNRGEAFNYESRLSARYNQVINKHIVAGQVTGELRSVNSLSRSFAVTGFSSDEFVDPSLAIQYREGSVPGSSENNTRAIAGVGTFDYSYDQRYTIQSSIRMDGSSLYGENERYQFFPSISGRWNIHRESFFQGLSSFVDLLSLRGSYGVSSTNDFNSYQAISTYVYEGKYYYNTAVSNLRNYGNPDLKWQNSKQLNIGFAADFFNRRLGFQFDYYNRMNDGMVIDINTPSSLGFSTYKSNLGAVRNRGLEGTITAMLVNKQHFTIQSKTMGRFNRSKLLNISEQYLNYLNTNANSARLTPMTRYMVGESINNIIGVRSLGIDPANGKEIYLTKDGQQTYIWDANDKVIIGNGESKFEGNQNFDIFYKNFTLFISTQYSVDKDIYNQTLVSRVEGVQPTVNVDRRVLQDRWKNPGDVTFYKDIADRSTSPVSDRFIQNENFLNINNITLRYMDRREWLKKYKIVDLSYSISMNDVARFSNVERERGTSYPFERSISGTLRITF